MDPQLTGLVLCFNEAPRIRRCLESLAFCNELVVVDSGSTDGTLDILRNYPVRLFHRPFVGCNDQKEFGRAQARGAWLLNLDADEVLSPELQEEVRRIVAQPEDAGPVAHEIPFRNHFRGVWVRRAGYYPDRHLRLFRRERGRWDRSVPVHDAICVEGTVGRLSGHIDHYSFQSLEHFLAKSRRYADGFAMHAFAQGRRAGALDMLSHTLWRFLKAYILKGGVLEGGLGAALSGLQAYEVFQKYARLWELSRFGEETRNPS